MNIGAKYMKIIIKLCPVCGKKYIPQGLKNHIINAAKSELWFNKKSKPHKKYYDKHCTIIKKNKSTLAFYKIK